MIGRRSRRSALFVLATVAALNGWSGGAAWSAPAGANSAGANSTGPNRLGPNRVGAASMDDPAGLMTVRSRYDVRGTMERFETAVRAHGWVVFTVIDHALAAKAAGLALRPRFVIVFGNPKAGTAAMAAHPTLAIDLPLKALIWQDDAGGVWLTLNSADWMAQHIFARHGIPMDDAGRAGLTDLLEQLAHATTD